MNPVTTADRRHPLAGLALLILVMLATPASALAHGNDAGAVVTNYNSEIVDAGVDGLTWNVRGGDGLIELTNDTGSEVTVFGYQGEPYLRFVPGDAVYRNASSPATHLNEDRYGDVDMPAGTSATAAAEWEPIAAGNSYSWHDHRTHWMSRIDPPAVALAGVLSALVAVVAVTTRPTPDRWVPLARVATSIVLLVVAANIVRVIDDLDQYATTSEQMVIIITMIVTLGAIAALCTRSWRGHPGGFGALAIAALMVMLLYGGEASGDMTAPQLDTSLPDVVHRWTIAASYTVVAPAFLAVGLGSWWYARTHRDIAAAEPRATARQS